MPKGLKNFRFVFPHLTKVRLSHSLKKKQITMSKKVLSLVAWGALMLLLPTMMTAQLQYSLKYDNAASQWGVYVKNTVPMPPTSRTTTGSGQVTIVVSRGFVFEGFQTVSGIWQQNARVNRPVENPTKDYISVGFQADIPQIVLDEQEPTLLFTFMKTGACPDEIYLMHNHDPFSSPNSSGSNPNNDMTIVNTNHGVVYRYDGVYEPCAGFCKPCDESQFEAPATTSTRFVVNPNFSIYPNPSNGTVNVQTTETFDKVKVFDVLGRVVAQFEEQQEVLNLNQLTEGQYLLLFENEGKPLHRERVVIQ